MLITVKVREGQTSDEVVSFLKKQENNGVKIVEIKTDEQINIEKLANEIAELMYNNTMDLSYDSEELDLDKIALRVNYNLTELQAIKEIIEFTCEKGIKCSFEISNHFYINAYCYRQNSREMINELQNAIYEICKKYGVEDDLVML